MRLARDKNVASLVWIVQGLYYASTGIWSIVGIESFQKVTGPKVDTWLVKTVGVLVTIIGGVLASAGLRRVQEPEITGLALGSALGLAAVDTFYALRGRISKVYLLDALAELGLVGMWIWLRSDRR